MPQNGLRMRPDELVSIIVAQIEDNDIDLIAEPAAAMVTDWERRDGHRWTAWGPLCLVCHAVIKVDAPGRAVLRLDLMAGELTRSKPPAPLPTRR